MYKMYGDYIIIVSKYNVLVIKLPVYVVLKQTIVSKYNVLVIKLPMYVVLKLTIGYIFHNTVQKTLNI